MYRKERCLHSGRVSAFSVWVVYKSCTEDRDRDREGGLFSDEGEAPILIWSLFSQYASQRLEDYPLHAKGSTDLEGFVGDRWKPISGPCKAIFEGLRGHCEALNRILESFGVSFSVETRKCRLCALTSGRMGSKTR